MVTGFEVYGAIAATIGLLNTARQGFQYLAQKRNDFKEIGPHMGAVYRQCNAIFVMIDNWVRYWFLDVETSDEVYKVYWGNQWQLIREHIGGWFEYLFSSRAALTIVRYGTRPRV